MFFIFPLKRDPHNTPPIISAITGLTRLGHKVVLYTYHVPEGSFADVEHENFELVLCSDIPYPKNLLSRIIASIKSYIYLFITFIKYKSLIDIIWVGAWDYKGLGYLARFCSNQVQLIYQFHEYEEFNFKYCRVSDYVVIPEANRGWITYVKAELPSIPLLLPNIPASHPRIRTEVNEEPLLEMLTKQKKKIVLYQGYLDVKKRCLYELLESLHYLSKEVVLVIMPAVDTSQKPLLEKKALELGVSDRLLFLDYRQAPEHLKIVSMADAGIGLYKPTSINQIYCAPNRLYEFVGFGIPVVLPSFPGIDSLASKYKCISTCDPSDPQSIANSLEYVLRCDKDALSTEAEKFWGECADYQKYLTAVLSRIKTV